MNGHIPVTITKRRLGYFTAEAVIGGDVIRATARTPNSARIALREKVIALTRPARRPRKPPVGTTWDDSIYIRPER